MKLSLLLFFISPFLCFAQGNESKPKRKISVGLSFSPDYSYRSLRADDNSGFSKFIINSRNEIEIPKFGFTTGIILLLTVNDKLTLETGLLYANKGEKTIDFSGAWITPDSPNDPLLPEPSEKFLFRYDYLYIDIPIKANYYLTKNRLKFFVSSGLSTNIFLFQRTTSFYHYEDGRIEKNSSNFGGLSRVNFAILGGIGAQFDLSDQFFFRFEPTYRRSITSIINAPIKGYLYSFGANAGFYFNPQRNKPNNRT